jgi:hypothetical protein
MGWRHGLLARPMDRTARSSPCPCRHDTKASACHGPPARPMTRHGHGTARGETRWLARLPHPAASPVAMAVAATVGHPRCGTRSSSSRPRSRSLGHRRTSSLWARGRAPPVRRREHRRTGELRPEPASPPPRAPHQSGADAPAPPSPTDATRRRRHPSSTLDSAPKLCRRLCQTATHSAADSPCSRAACGTLCSQHDTMAHVPCRGPKAWSMAQTSTTRLARRDTTQCRHGTARHGRAACRVDTARWPSIQQPPSAGDWYFDIGASAYMSSSPGILTDPRPLPTPASITVGNGAQLPVTHTAHAQIPTSSTPLHLNNVLVSPPLMKNLILLKSLPVTIIFLSNLTLLDFPSRIFQQAR